MNEFENVTDLEVSPCPECGAKLNAASPSDRSQGEPKPGDYSMCFYCGEYLRFDDELQLHTLSAKDIVEAPLVELSSMRRQMRTEH